MREDILTLVSIPILSSRPCAHDALLQNTLLARRMPGPSRQQWNARPVSTHHRLLEWLRSRGRNRTLTACASRRDDVQARSDSCLQSIALVKHCPHLAQLGLKRSARGGAAVLRRTTHECGLEQPMLAPNRDKRLCKVPPLPQRRATSGTTTRIHGGDRRLSHHMVATSGRRMVRAAEVGAVVRYHSATRRERCVVPRVHERPTRTPAIPRGVCANEDSLGATARARGYGAGGGRMRRGVIGGATWVAIAEAAEARQEARGGSGGRARRKEARAHGRHVEDLRRLSNECPTVGVGTLEVVEELGALVAFLFDDVERRERVSDGRAGWRVIAGWLASG